MRTRFFLVGTGIFVLLVVSLGIGLVLLLPRDTGKQTTSTAPTPTLAPASAGATTSFTEATASDSETVTVYPGVTNVIYLIHQGDEHGWSITGNYVTGATPVDVLQFYDSHFLSAGWALASTNGSTGGSVESHDYLWTDRTKTVPWDLALEVWVNKIDSPTGTPTGTRVQATLSRQPSLSRVPIYPSARQLESHWESSSTIRGFGKTYFSYLTDAAPDQVNAFYLDALPQSGWARSRGTSGDIRTGGFEYEWHLSRTGSMIDYQRDSYITIKATSISAGNTEVQIVLASQIRTGGLLDRNDYTP